MPLALCRASGDHPARACKESSVKRAFRVAAFAAVAVCGACGSKTPPLAPPTEESVVGLYSLRTVNGALPYLVGGNDTSAVYIVAGHLDFRADKTFTDVLTHRINYSTGDPSTEETTTLTGTYTLFDSNLALVYTSIDPIGYDTVAVIGPRVHQSRSSLLHTYRK